MAPLQTKILQRNVKTPPKLRWTFFQTTNHCHFLKLQGVSNILWALGQLQHPHPPLLHAVCLRFSQPGALQAFDGQVRVLMGGFDGRCEF